MNKLTFFLACALALHATAVVAQPPGGEGANLQLKDEVERLRKQIEEQKQKQDAEIEKLRRQVQALSPSRPEAEQSAKDEMAAVVSGRQRDLQKREKSSWSSNLPRAFQSLNPDLSVVMDTFYHNDDTKDGIEHLLGDMAGFGHSHGGDEHQHAGIEDGFNLRHLELSLSAEADPYFKGWATVAVAEEAAELEEAVIQTTSLPWGLQLQAGKFFSGFGRINAQHSHEWDFVDQPLIYRLTFGSHGLNEKGLQLSWLAPTPFYLLAGAEVFQGENETMFNHVGGDHLSKKEGPRLGVGWLKFGPNLRGPHGLQMGLFGGRGVHEEAHDGDSDGTEDHWLQGHSLFYGADVVYKYDSPQPYGKGDFTLQAEYMRRKKDIEVKQHDLNPALVGRDKVDEQDGLYVQGAYGFLPRWRGGLRWDQVGLINSSKSPDGSRDHFGSSYRASAMVDFTPTEFSRLRLQVGRGEYALSHGREGAWEVSLQLMISLGTHGAHKF